MSEQPSESKADDSKNQIPESGTAATPAAPSKEPETASSESKTSATVEHESKFLLPDASWAMLILRAWLGLRLILAGMVKFRSWETDGSIKYSAENYKEWVDGASRPFIEYGGLPSNLVHFQSGLIAYLLIASGIMLLLGITNRIAILFASAVFVMISFGLFTLDDSPEIAYIGIHIILCAMAMALARHNRLCLINKL